MNEGTEVRRNKDMLRILERNRVDYGMNLRFCFRHIKFVISGIQVEVQICSQIGYRCLQLCIVVRLVFRSCPSGHFIKEK